MSGFLNVIKKNLGLGRSKQTGEPKESTATAKPAKKSKGSAYFLELDDAKGVGANNDAAAPAKAEAAPTSVEPSTNGKKPAAKKADAKAKPEAKVAAAPAPKPAAPVVKQATTFAPDYLISPNSYSGRRRPGANMNYFLNLARQAKTPNK